MPSAERLRELAEAREPRLQLVAPFVLLPGPDVTEVLLVRHAQVPQGMTTEDSPLTEIGYEQSRLLAGYLAAFKIDAVYASPAARAHATAEAVATSHSLQVQVNEQLRDVDSRLSHELAPLDALIEEFGAAEGTRRYEAMTQGGWSFDLFGGLMESSASLRGRVTAAIDDIVRANPGGRVVAVSHGPTISAYVADVLGSPADFCFYPRLTSISSVLARGESRQVHLLNALPHFGAL